MSAEQPKPKAPPSKNKLLLQRAGLNLVIGFVFMQVFNMWAVDTFKLSEMSFMLAYLLTLPFTLTYFKIDDSIKVHQSYQSFMLKELTSIRVYQHYILNYTMYPMTDEEKAKVNDLVDKRNTL